MCIDWRSADDIVAHEAASTWLAKFDLPTHKSRSVASPRSATLRLCSDKVSKSHVVSPLGCDDATLVCNRKEATKRWRCRLMI